MKNFLLFVLTLCTSLSINAQQFIKNEAHSDGARDILTTPMEIYSYSGHTTDAALSYISIPMETGEYVRYVIVFTLNEGRVEIDEGKKLLVKFSDESILELSNSYDIGPDDWFAVEARSGVEYRAVVSYRLTEEQLQELVGKKAVKLRIETNTRILDREIQGNKMSKNLGTLYTYILNTLLEKKDFYSDF